MRLSSEAQWQGGSGMTDHTVLFIIAVEISKIPETIMKKYACLFFDLVSSYTDSKGVKRFLVLFVQDQVHCSLGLCWLTKIWTAIFWNCYMSQWVCLFTGDCLRTKPIRWSEHGKSLWDCCRLRQTVWFVSCVWRTQCGTVTQHSHAKREEPCDKMWPCD